MVMPVPTPADALRLVQTRAPQWWRAGDVDAIEAACAAVPADALMQWPELAYWRGLAAAMRERGEALACLECAHAGFMRQGQVNDAQRTAQAALVLCLLDIGAMDRVNDWLARAAGPEASTPADDEPDVWRCLGTLAREVLGDARVAAADAAAIWLHAQLRPLRELLSPDERLIAAQVLVNHHFACQQYEQFDFLATLVEDPARFDQALPLSRGRWHHTLGFAHYQIGRHRQAEECWQRALALGETHALHGLQLQTSLALVRLLLDRGRVAEADALLAAVQPPWGAGRVMQLVALQQMRARVLLMRRQPAQALATVDEALALAESAGLSASERASCLTDQAQALLALDRLDEAEALLQRLAQEHGGRDARVYACLHGLLRAWRLRQRPTAMTQALTAAMQSAQQIRYTMFFRLLPAFAAELCALALRSGVEPAFVVEVIRERALPAPPGADARWPWPLQLRLFGGFEMQRAGVRQVGAGKTAHKPLELLRLLACERTLAIGMQAAAEMLWPDADAVAARKNLEMTVQRLRRLLADDTLVRVGDGRVSLDAGRCSSDVLQRRSAIDRLEALALHPTTDVAMDADKGDVEAECSTLMAGIVQLTSGDLLPGAPDAPWLEAQRTQCRRETVRAALAAATLMERAGVDTAERELLQAALRIEPLAEALVRRLMRAYERDGQRADAVRIYERLRADLQVQGLAPSAQTEAIWRRLFDPASS